MRKTHDENRYIHRVVCDCCGRRMEASPGCHLPQAEEWQEAVTVAFHAEAQTEGVFEKGNWYYADICQHCLKERLGKYMRITWDGPPFRKRPAGQPRNTYDQHRLEQRFIGEALLEPLLEAFDADPGG